MKAISTLIPHFLLAVLAIFANKSVAQSAVAADAKWGDHHDEHSMHGSEEEHHHEDHHSEYGEDSGEHHHDEGGEHGEWHHHGDHGEHGEHRHGENDKWNYHVEGNEHYGEHNGEHHHGEHDEWHHHVEGGEHHGEYHGEHHGEHHHHGEHGGEWYHHDWHLDEARDQPTYVPLEVSRRGKMTSSTTPFLAILILCMSAAFYVGRKRGAAMVPEGARRFTNNMGFEMPLMAEDENGQMKASLDLSGRVTEKV